MTTTKKIGDRGEEQAINYLLNLDYKILEKNFRYKRNEIDIIAEKEKCLIFIEVKYRSNTSFGFGEDFVNEAKMERLDDAANYYILKSDWKENIRFDIIAINKEDIKHFEDVY